MLQIKEPRKGAMEAGRSFPSPLRGFAFLLDFTGSFAARYFPVTPYGVEVVFSVEPLPLRTLARCLNTHIRPAPRSLPLQFDRIGFLCLALSFQALHQPIQ